MYCNAKINVFLKICGKSNNYHELISRFRLVDDLYDELFIIPKSLAKDLHFLSIHNINLHNLLKEKAYYCIGCDDKFIKLNPIVNNYASVFMQDTLLDRYYLQDDNLISNFYSKNNIFYKVLDLLDKSIKNDFLENYAIFLHKNIPTFAGLGGASSNAASFIMLLNELYDIDVIKLASLSGADVSFFVSGYKSANVYGYGQIVEEFIDDDFNFKLEFACKSSTKDVFLEYSKNPNYYKNDELSKLSSKTLLNNYTNYELNDLLKPCLALYPKANICANNGLYLSGSGGSFFQKID